MDKKKFFKLINGLVAVVFFTTSSTQTTPLTNRIDTLRPPSAVNEDGLTNESADLERALKTSSAEADTRKGPFIISENLEYNIVETEHLFMRLWLTAGEGSYLYTGFMTRGDHPRNLSGKNIINDLGGLCSGPKLAKRFAAILKTADILYAGAVRAVIDDYRKKNLAREKDLPDVNSILDILITQRELTKKEKMLKSKAEDAVLVSIDDAARKGNVLAKEFIAGVGKEIGRALAAFIAAYQNEDFVEHIILVSGVNEKIGKGVTNEAGEDLYVATIRKAAIDELIKNYKMPEDRAGNIAAGIERSDMTYEREFLAFKPKEGVNLAVSMGGYKLAVNLVDEKGGLLLKKSVELPWREKLDIAPEDKDFWKRENADAFMDLVEKLIEAALRESNKDISQINRIGIAFAGPVNPEKGIAGTPFKAPNIPFVDYLIIEELQFRIASKLARTDMPVKILNDCEAAVKGELSIRGKLHKFGYGCAMIVGGGINITAAKNGEVYYGEYDEIRELGHNLVSKVIFRQQLESSATAGHYIYTGRMTKGKRPRDLDGNLIGLEFANICTASGLVKKFAERLISGSYLVSKDGEAIRKRIKEFIERNPGIEKDISEAVPDGGIINVLKVIVKKTRLTDAEAKASPGIIEAVLNGINQEALNGNRLAIKWIRDAGREIGRALTAVFAAAYKHSDKPIKEEVIASGVYENLARHIKDKNERDLYIGAIQDGAMYELTFIYGIDEETAKRFAGTIRRDTKREAISLTIDIPAKSSSAGENFSKDAPFSENNPMPRQDRTQWDMAKAMSSTLGKKILTRALDIHTEHIIELKTLEELAIKAADMLVEYRKKHPGKIDIMHKDMTDDGDPLTTAVTKLEIRVQDFYINQLHQIFPSWRFVAEEGVVPELSDDGKADYVCIIDPIDGTREFTRRGKHSGLRFQPMFKHIEYGTGIALFERLADGRLKPIISIAILPEIDIDGAGFSIGEAVDDIEGAFLNGKKMDMVRLTPSQLCQKDVIVEPRRDQKTIAERITREFKRAFLDVSSLCHFMFLAAGEKYSDIAGTMNARPQVWDVAIGGFIGQKAGARVVYLNDGNNLFPIDPKRIYGEFRTDSIFAAAPNTVTYILRRLRETGDLTPGTKPGKRLGGRRGKEGGAESLLPYPNPHSKMLRLDPIDRKNFTWNKRMKRWVHKKYKGLVLGEVGDIKRDMALGAEFSAMKNDVVIRTKLGFSMYIFDSHDKSSDYIDDATVRKEVYEKENIQLWIDNHSDTYLSDRKAGYGPGHIAITIAEKGAISGHIWISKHRTGEGITKDEGIDVVKRHVKEYKHLDMKSYFRWAGRPKNTRTIINICSDIAPSNEIIDFLRRLFEEDSLVPSTVHVSTSPSALWEDTIDATGAPTCYGDVEVCKDVAEFVLSKETLRTIERNVTNLRRQDSPLASLVESPIALPRSIESEGKIDRLIKQAA